MRRRAAAGFLALVAAACTTTASGARALDDARRVDDDAVAAHESEIDGPSHAGKWIVVQRGAIAAAASLPDDAVRAAAGAGPPPIHRFVFRPSERGPKFYRLAYVADGGVVVGRRFLADLGLAAGADPTVLRRTGGGAAVDVGKSKRLSLVVDSLDGSTHANVQAAYDADFDGGLLLTPALATSLALEQFEIPGETEVQVTLGRPFRARRATVIVKIPAVEASGAAEAVYEVAAARK